MKLFRVAIVVVLLLFLIAFGAATAARADVPTWTTEAPAKPGFGWDVFCPVNEKGLGCNVLNVRNVQGGTNADPDLDIGAGSTVNPGTLTLQYDVGDRTNFYAGQKIIRMQVRRDALTMFDQWGEPLARFGPGRQIVFYAKPKVRG